MFTQISACYQISFFIQSAHSFFLWAVFFSKNTWRSFRSDVIKSAYRHYFVLSCLSFIELGCIYLWAVAKETKKIRSLTFQNYVIKRYNLLLTFRSLIRHAYHFTVNSSSKNRSRTIQIYSYVSVSSDFSFFV